MTSTSQPRPLTSIDVEPELTARILLCSTVPNVFDVLVIPLLENHYPLEICAADPHAITAALRQHAHSVGMVVLDARADLQGPLDVVRALRTTCSSVALPIILLMDQASADDQARAIEAGADELLMLPMAQSMLALRLRNLHQRSALHRVNTTIRSDMQAHMAKLDMLIENGMMLSMERKAGNLCLHTLIEGQRLLHCDGGTLFLMTPERTLRFAERTRADALPVHEIALTDPSTGMPNDRYVAVHVALHNRAVLIDDVYAETRFDLSGTRDFDRRSSYRTVSLLTVPLAPRNGEVIGVMQFMNAIDPVTGAHGPFQADMLKLVEALGAQAAVALDNLQLVDAQKNMMESMIQVLATAIDAKSPYTGRHCERVPTLAMMLARAACDTTEGPLASFDFAGEDAWYEFRVGAWLHDCGKVTTPEHVIDKGTKLETIHNRLHEIRTRFEVLLRDATIARLTSQLAGVDAATAETVFDIEQKRLTDEFSFLAALNIGGEAIDTARIERLQAIAQRSWLRHFDDRIGLSPEESKRYEGLALQTLPAREFLLADKSHHVVPRSADLIPDPAFGFKVTIPEALYNYGEVYNLSVPRGTLTEEERFKINEHMIHGIMMLERMNFPRSLQRVPEYAGTHHETLDGQGYPRRLNASQLSIPARIVAIADIFEALSACDRPYKSTKMLSETLQILGGLKRRGLIDGDLFDLFLRSGVHLDYAHRFMLPEQIDTVDIEALVRSSSPL